MENTRSDCVWDYLISVHVHECTFFSHFGREALLKGESWGGMRSMAGLVDHNFWTIRVKTMPVDKW
jgi:hypothetical protein